MVSHLTTTDCEKSQLFEDQYPFLAKEKTDVLHYGYRAITDCEKSQLFEDQYPFLAKEKTDVLHYGYRAITDCEKSWLSKHQHQLFVKEKDNVIYGDLRFRAEAELCNKERKVYLHNSSLDSPSESYIEDSYRVHFGLDKRDWTPKIWETEGKLLKQLRPHGINNPRDAHVNNDGLLCLGVSNLLREKVRINLTLGYVINWLIIPYFYYHSYWAKFGIEPWPGLAHGDIGVLQSYFEEGDNLLDPTPWENQLSPSFRKKIRHEKIRRNDRCLCDKKVKANRCRCMAVEGYKRLQRNLQ